MISFDEKALKRAKKHVDKYGTPIECAYVKMALAHARHKGTSLNSLELNRLFADHAISEAADNVIEQVLNEAEAFDPS